MNSPVEILLEYQREWYYDAARFKIGLMARQTGKSFTSAAEVTADARQRAGVTWVILSAGERQALEFMGKVKAWARAWDFAISTELEERDAKESLLKSAEVIFPNGSRVIALPANPATARGYTANLLLDEFAFHEDPDAIWRAIYPSISNPLTGGLKKVRIISTPNGKANKFYDLWTKNSKYSKHKVTIYDAVKKGLPIDIDELKSGLDDPDGWAQEYECQFIDSAMVLLPYDLLARCEDNAAVEQWRADALYVPGEYYLGVDIGRKKDLTVFWLWIKEGDVLRCAGVHTFEKTPFHQQLQFLLDALKSPYIRRACVDATGIGAMLAEEAQRLAGNRVQPCVYNAAFKEEIFLDLKRAFEDRRVRIPSSRTIREDFHGLQKITTAAGNTRIFAPHNDDGHCDRANGAALGLYGAKILPFPGDPIAVPDFGANHPSFAVRGDRALAG